MAFVDLQKGTLVLYSDGAIVDQGKCPKHVSKSRGRCTCQLVVKVIYEDQMLAHRIFNEVVSHLKLKKKKDKR